ncbi:MAG: M48 metallopeptidase family protein [Gemmatimonadaceae bacterium]
MTPKTATDPRGRLRSRVGHWARRLEVTPRTIRIQRMVRKWGSCSTNGVITLADDLAHRSPAFQDFVIAHELLHMRIPNHGRLFKAVLSAHVPGWRSENIAKPR